MTSNNAYINMINRFNIKINKLTEDEARAYLYKLCPFIQYKKLSVSKKYHKKILQILENMESEKNSSFHVFEMNYKFQREREVHVFEYFGASGIEIQIWKKQKI